jgi:hypothetical protein
LFLPDKKPSIAAWPSGAGHATLRVIWPIDFNNTNSGRTKVAKHIAKHVTNKSLIGLKGWRALSPAAFISRQKIDII